MVVFKRLSSVDGSLSAAASLPSGNRGCCCCWSCCSWLVWFGCCRSGGRGCSGHGSRRAAAARRAAAVSSIAEVAVTATGTRSPWVWVVWKWRAQGSTGTWLCCCSGILSTTVDRDRRACRNRPSRPRIAVRSDTTVQQRDRKHDSGCCFCTVLVVCRTCRWLRCANEEPLSATTPRQRPLCWGNRAEERQRTPESERGRSRGSVCVSLCVKVGPGA